MELQRRIVSLRGEFLLFALTPPRLSTTPEKAQEIADITVERLERLDVDGLILYDIDDEADRNPTERPSPSFHDGPGRLFRPASRNLAHAGHRLPRDGEVYRTRPCATGLRARTGQTNGCFRRCFLAREASSRRSAGRSSSAEVNAGLLLGAVAIPERHTRKGDEHLRLIAKQEAGCAYFATQVVYDVNAAKNLVSDYVYACRDRGLDPLPIVFTLSVCGSMKTLEFLRWLGVDVPALIENALRHADDTLDASLEYAAATGVELMSFCRRLGVPFGINVDSVSIRKVEIEASVRLAERLRSNLIR